MMMEMGEKSYARYGAALHPGTKRKSQSRRAQCRLIAACERAKKKQGLESQHPLYMRRIASSQALKSPCAVSGMLRRGWIRVPGSDCARWAWVETRVAHHAALSGHGQVS